MSNILFLDFETRSTANLKDIGSTAYSLHPNTQVLCLGYAVNHKEPSVLYTYNRGNNVSGDLRKFKQAVDECDFFVAHNIAFDFCIMSNIFTKFVFLSEQEEEKLQNPNNWMDTMAMAVVQGLPLSLNNIAKALGETSLKDKDGANLMKKLALPVRYNEIGIPIYAEEDMLDPPSTLNQLYDYCMQDICVLQAIYYKLPLLTSFEEGVFKWNTFDVNIEGINIDRDLILQVLTIHKNVLEQANKRILEITNNKVKSIHQVGALLTYVNSKLGNPLPNLTNATIEKYYSLIKDQDILEILKYRLDITNIGKKFDTLYTQSSIDSKAHDMFLYYGAHTGRFVGKRVQPQNLPKFQVPFYMDPILFPKKQFIKDVVEGEDLEKYPLSILNSTLRLSFVASKGKTFFGADYSNIELRILLYSVKSKWLDALSNEEVDLYVKLASLIYSKSEDDITKGERFIGKVATLGLGYGMGIKKFSSYLEIAMKSKPSEEFVLRIYKKFHEMYPEIKSLWSNIEDRAIKTIISWEGDKKFQLNPIHNINRLQYILPSGRYMNFLYPTIEEGVIHYKTYNNFIKKYQSNTTWGGKLVENIIQGIARDILVDACLRLKASNMIPKLHIHDEVVCEVDPRKYTLDDFTDILTTPPLWLGNYPIAVESWEANRYYKI